MKVRFAYRIMTVEEPALHDEVKRQGWLLDEDNPEWRVIEVLDKGTSPDGSRWLLTVLAEKEMSESGIGRS